MTAVVARRRGSNRARLDVVICFLTTWAYPYHEVELAELEAVATLPLLERNGLYVVLLVWLGRWWYRARRTSSIVGPASD